MGNAARTASEASEAGATLLRLYGEMANVKGGYDRRQDDWKFQTKSAALELKQVEKQIAGAEIRLTIAEKELENHDLQRDQSKEVDDYLKSKFTNEELYDHMVGQISSVYFQSYQLAYNTAKKAQKCFECELGVDNTSFIQFGYWDSLKKGLLSGEKLQYDLRRLETAYLEQNRREFELTKSISLLLLNPLALVKLRETGRCSINLPEEIFDLDFPGHYFRRMKSVSLTLPCVVGPYTTVSCTLRLLKNSIRINTTNGNGYPHLPADDDRFVENNIPVKAIAASSAQNNSGVFELSFRDERYLPFEGAGAVSEWSLELFSDRPANNPDRDTPTSASPCDNSITARFPTPSCTLNTRREKTPVPSKTARWLIFGNTFVKMSRRPPCVCSTCGRNFQVSGSASYTQPLRYTGMSLTWRCQQVFFPSGTWEKL